MLQGIFSYSQEKKDSIARNQQAIALDTVNIFAIGDAPIICGKEIEVTYLPFKSNSALKNFLNEVTNLYIKEYGRGMIASISIRGTNASHTQILWNGIPINSSLNGQTDLNTVYMPAFNSNRLYLGGKSVFVGSGAIGGAIDLLHKIRFKKKFLIENDLNYGSFQSINNALSITKSTKKIYFNVNVVGNYSKNNYLFPDTKIINQNGKYFGKDLSINTGYKLNESNNFDFRTHFNILNRNLSGTLYAPGNSKLNTNNYQGLIGWNYKKNNVSNRLITAWVYENFDYYPNKDNSNFTNNKSQSYYFKDLLNYNYKKNRFIIGNQLNTSIGQGDGIGKHKTNNYAVFVNFQRNIFKQFTSNISIRKEFNSLYSIPFLGSFEILFKNKKKSLQTRFFVSNNFKAPTFNDLYWQPGGNPDLKPEKSYTFELNQNVILTNFYFDIGLFYIKSNNLIRWKPVTSNFWQPINIQSVISKGLELKIYKFIEINGNNNLRLQGSYTYQQVKDVNNNSFLTFVPKHIANFTADFQGRKYEIKLTNSYTGKVFTTTSNSIFMKAYYLLNMDFSYQLTDYLRVGGAINNVLDNYYETYPSRPQPGRNYNLNINIKIK